MTQLPRLPALAFAQQPDEALRLLAQLYHRWFQAATTAATRLCLPPTRGEIFACLRSALLAAEDQPDALARLRALSEAHQVSPEAPDWTELVARASTLIEQVRQAGGTITPLVAGETDGTRHLCLRCSSQCPPEQSVRFFNARDRRLLLKPEIGGATRSVYTRCQRCLQALNPEQCVRLVLAGTSKHDAGCACGCCNRAGVATLLHLYACDWQTQAIQLPQLPPPIEAPSRQQCIERAIERCWQAGWYILNPEVLPPPAAPKGSPTEPLD